MGSLGIGAEFTCATVTLNLTKAVRFLSGQHAVMSFKKEAMHVADGADAESKEVAGLNGVQSIQAKEIRKTQSCQLDGKLTVLLKAAQ